MNRAACILVGMAVMAGTVAQVSAGPERSPPPPLDREPAEAKPPAAPPAEHKRTVGILDVRVDGVPDEVRVKFERNLEEQLDTAHYWLASRSKMRERMKFSTKWTEGCLVGACLVEARTQTQAELVLLAALSGSGTSFGYVVSVLRTDNGRVLAQEASRCDVCTVDEAMNEATLATIKLLNQVPDKLPDDSVDRGAAVNLAVVPLEQRLAVRKRHDRRVGITMTVLGLATAGAGAAAYFLASHPRYSYVVIGAGAGLTFGGVVALTF